MKPLLFMLLCLFVLSCANQGNLIGGEVDEIPPKLIAASPQNGSLNFTSNRFELLFDENIQVKDLNKNLLVSPFLENKPKVKVKPQSIQVEILEELQPNTTYTFNFGNAIQDLNEGNELAGFSYVFSTGEVLDSASLSGSVLFAKEGLPPEEGVWALLYDSLEDSLFLTTPPSYATPVLEDGSFQFQNVKDGDYRLFALRDQNFNYFYDLPNEELAFTDSLIQVKGKISSTQLSLFSQPIERAFVKKSVNDQFQSILIETSVEPTKFEFQFFPPSSPLYKNIYQDSIRMWFAQDDSVPDSAFVFVDKNTIDTIFFRKKELELNDTTFKFRLNNSNPFIFQKRLYIESNRPFSINENRKPVLLEDSLFVAGGIEFERDSLLDTRLYLNYDWANGKSYDIEFDDSSFTNLFSQPSDSLSVSFSVPATEDLSVLSVNFVTDNQDNTPLIFQLLKGSETFYTQSTTPDKTLNINNLPPGKYKSRIIFDNNANQQWDSGNYGEHRQPERVLFFETEIELRPNWDFEVEINLDE